MAERKHDPLANYVLPREMASDTRDRATEETYGPTPPADYDGEWPPPPLGRRTSWLAPIIPRPGGIPIWAAVMIGASPFVGLFLNRSLGIWPSAISLGCGVALCLEGRSIPKIILGIWTVGWSSLIGMSYWLGS